MKEDLQFSSRRKDLVEELQRKGISDSKVLDAIYQVPRHIFFDAALRMHAYDDKAFPIDAGQTISQPYTVAFQTQLLEIKPQDKILEIGTGSGYQASVLLAMGARVYTIERQKKLYFKTKQIFQDLHLFIHTFLGDGFKGLPQFAPYDKVIITAAAPYIPRTLLEQLKIGGYMVAPVGEGSMQKMIRIKKISETDFEQTEYGQFSFVPMLEGLND